MQNKIKISTCFIMLSFYASLAQAVIAGNCTFKLVKALNNKNFKLFITSAIYKGGKDRNDLSNAASTTKGYKKILLNVHFFFSGADTVSFGYLIDNNVWQTDIVGNEEVLWSIDDKKKGIKLVNLSMPGYENATVDQSKTMMDVTEEGTVIDGKGTKDEPYVLKSIGDPNYWQISLAEDKPYFLKKIEGSNPWQISIVESGQWNLIGQSAEGTQLTGRGTCIFKLPLPGKTIFSINILNQYAKVKPDVGGENKTGDKETDKEIPQDGVSAGETKTVD